MQECNDWLPKLFGYLFLGVIVWFTGQDRTGQDRTGQDRTGQVLSSL